MEDDFFKSDTHCWQTAVHTIAPFVFKIATPVGTGTGFLVYRDKETSLCAVATAAHVVDHPHEWQQPIRLHHHTSKKSKFLAHENRVISIDHETDTAIIAFYNLPEDDSFELHEINQVKQMPVNAHFDVGMEIGWVGFPAVSPDNLCFFSGRISCVLPEKKSYLVDGVAI